MAKNWTMTDIALAAGVSQTTVSMVLNDVAHARIAESTRERVLKVAEEMGYAKGPRFENGRCKETRIVCMLIDEVGVTQWYQPLLEGADDEARIGNCLVAAYRTRGDPSIEAAAIAMLPKNRLAGVLYATLTKRIVKLPEALHAIPTVMLNCNATGGDCLSVISADLPAAYTATEALLRAGHRRIAHLAGDKRVVAGQEREQGYRQALLNWDIPVDSSLILYDGGPSFQDGREMTDHLLDLPQPPTAIFCYNDRTAIGAYEAIRARGLRIPDDISVVGFDNEIELTRRAFPPLTTVALPHEQMARQAVKILLDIENIRSTSQHPRMIKVECPIVLRESIGPPKPNPPSV
jgi:LacI family transcriptional regulator